MEVGPSTFRTTAHRESTNPPFWCSLDQAGVREQDILEYRRTLHGLASWLSSFEDGRVLTVGSIVILHVQLAQTKVAKRNVPRVVEQNVLGLQVAVDDVESMQAFQSAKQFRRVKSRPIDVKSLLSLKMMEEFATIDESENEVKLFRRLEGKLERNDEGIVDLSKNRAFGQSVCDFGSRDNMGLADGFESIDSMRVSFPIIVSKVSAYSSD